MYWMWKNVYPLKQPWCISENLHWREVFWMLWVHKSLSLKSPLMAQQKNCSGEKLSEYNDCKITFTQKIPLIKHIELMQKRDFINVVIVRKPLVGVQLWLNIRRFEYGRNFMNLLNVEIPSCWNQLSSVTEHIQERTL